MSKTNKFGIAPLDTGSVGPRQRSLGPMGAAVREAADDLQAATEAKVEQRRQNAADAKTYREAAAEGRVIVRVPLDEIETNDLPRDRINLHGVAVSEAMDELKASIRARGQKEPVELYYDREGRLQLKKGWRRYNALCQLHNETGDDAFATILARIDQKDPDRLEHYIDMVEENVVREDLSFGEMAQVVIEAVYDYNVPERDPEVLIGKLYGSLHKRKRSYIRSFVYLMMELDGSLGYPHKISRNLGAEVARKMQAEGGIEKLAAELKETRSPEEQQVVLEAYVAAKSRAKARPVAGQGASAGKFSFKVGTAKVTARKGECRIAMDVDFTSVPRDELEAAIKEFEARVKR